MKKLLLLFVGVLPMLNLNAQDITDAVRYSQENIQGTARFRALSGAFGALGGDMSAVSLNPAGSAIFNNTHASASLSSLNINNNVDYFNGTTTASNSEFDLHQGGAAFVMEETDNSPWRKLVLSIAYDKTANFNTDWIARATNSNQLTSIGSYFLANANGLPLGNITALENETDSQAYANIGSQFGTQYQDAFLGYASYILEPVDNSDNNNIAYTSNVGAAPNSQQYAYDETGYNGKMSFNIATQFQDNLYLGLNLNSHFINYKRTSQLLENNNATGAVINEVYFKNSLSTLGSGFSFQLGGIFKVNKSFRLGLTYNSPTWYSIEEETAQGIETFSRDGISANSTNTNETFRVNPDVVNVFPEYRLQTPSKLTGSAALVFGKQGLISFDYSRKDYSKTKFKPKDDPSFTAQNDLIAQNLKVANEFRVGAEYKYERFSFRGGYRFEDSPYKNDKFYGDLKGYSLGLGYNFGNTKLDLAYDTAERDFNHQLYTVGLTDTAGINRTNDNITLTLSFNL